MNLARPLTTVVATVSLTSSASFLHRPLVSFAGSSNNTTSNNNNNNNNNNLPWSHVTVEWNPKVARLHNAKPEIFSGVVTNWVFPDLPHLYTKEHRHAYLQATSTRPSQRIQTLATCLHTTWQSLVETAKQRILEQHDDEVSSSSSTSFQGKLLLVGGNDKSPSTISTVQAATILQSELSLPSEHLWAVADPNDPNSPLGVQAKIDAGISGFLTQPLLTSTAWDTLYSYYDSIPSSKNDVSFVAGMALPRTAKNLQYWKHLLDCHDELVEQDPLFQSHLAYFSQPYTTPLAWIGRELQQYVNLAAATATSTTKKCRNHGVHFMPLQNTQDLEVLLRSLSRHQLNQ